MDEEPIYNFVALRNHLVRLGYIVEQAQGYREIRPEEVTIDSINRGELEVTEEGIFVIGPGSQRQQVFLYKRDYRLETYGKPRFHICRCGVINDFIVSGRFREHYVRANSDPVPVYNIDNRRREVMVDELPLCKLCLSKIREYGNMTSTDFVKILREARGTDEEPEVHEVDIFGYTRDWDDISRQYREAHNYTCERCGLRIDDIFDRQYIHCHHKDENKLNNRDSNLECLCLRCHSKVDDYHHHNLTTGANRIIMEEFEKKYPNNRNLLKNSNILKV